MVPSNFMILDWRKLFFEGIAIWKKNPDPKFREY